MLRRDDSEHCYLVSGARSSESQCERQAGTGSADRVGGGGRCAGLCACPARLPGLQCVVDSDAPNCAPGDRVVRGAARARGQANPVRPTSSQGISPSRQGRRGPLVVGMLGLPVQAGGQLVEACIGLAVPGRPIGPWSRGTERRRRPRPDATARRRSSKSVRGGRGPATGACWACRGSASPGYGSRMAAASVSVARKRRLADRAGGDLW
jgi:hypothetical protein